MRKNPQSRRPASIKRLLTGSLVSLSLVTTTQAHVQLPSVVPGETPAAPAPTLVVNDVIGPHNTVKVLVCGDSISQGLEGDFTWRYRLWQWFQGNQTHLHHRSQYTYSYGDDNDQYDDDGEEGGIGGEEEEGDDDDDGKPGTHLTPRLQYVGPYNGTLPTVVGPANVNLKTPQSWGSYNAKVDPAFSPGNGSAHFAVFGRPASGVVDLIQDKVTTYAPDILVLHLGLNDFGWWSQTADQLLETMQKLVSNARLGRKDVKILITDVSHRYRVDGRNDLPPTTDDYNARLGDKVQEWSTPESPVLVVRVSEAYACHVDSCPAGTDGLHPNALGEYQIARAYSKVLHEQFLFGQAPLAVPRLKKLPGWKATFKPMAILASPPVGIFMCMSILCLGVVYALRPHWMRARAEPEKKYELLPTTAREGMEGL